MNCLATVSRYASLVKFSHTIFALPFALVGYVYALQSNGLPFEEWPALVKVLLAMVLARDTAMGFNRWADRRIDAQNPRTSGREIPSGTISRAQRVVVRRAERRAVRSGSMVDQSAGSRSVARRPAGSHGVQPDQALYRPGAISFWAWRSESLRSGPMSP